jgi:hypothetical protein
MNKLDEPLSDSKVKQALGDATRVIKYSELKNYDTMADLLPKINDFVIILLEEDVNRGHWTALMKPHGGYYYFNSYGTKYDTDISVIPMCIRKILGEDKREITRLLDGHKCDWNRTKLQGEKSQVCGRWCILAITTLCFMGYSPADFIEFVKEKAKKLNKTCDELVVSLVNL